MTAIADPLKRKEGSRDTSATNTGGPQSSATMVLSRCRAWGSALDAENRSVAIDGAKLVYRRFGNAEMEGPPLVCLQHFHGNLTTGIRRWSIASLRIAR